jgi:enoyl-CoA hydratase/carnithine racemase
MQDRIRVVTQDGIADVRMIRAEKMNALDAMMFEALAEAGERLRDDAAVRAVVLSGEGRAGMASRTGRSTLSGSGASFRCR